MDIFLPEKWKKNCACLWTCVFMVEKDPSGFVTIITLRLCSCSCLFNHKIPGY